jgi:hypothetical protein
MKTQEELLKVYEEYLDKWFDNNSILNNVFPLTFEKWKKKNGYDKEE